MLKLVFQGTSLSEFFMTQPTALEAHGAGGADVLQGSAVRDVLFGDGGRDFLIGLTGNDFLGGGLARDLLIGGAGRDTMKGDAGNDFMNGEEDQDRMIGGTGKDTMWGGLGSDRLTGGDGNDALYGSTGTVLPPGDWSFPVNWNVLLDIPISGSAAGVPGKVNTVEASLDILNGGGGRDLLDGGAGNDRLTGGPGADTFVVSYGVVNADSVSDFRHGVDKILLAKNAFSALGASIEASEFRLGGVAKDDNDFLLYKKAAGQFFYDIDADQAGAPQLIATLAGKPLLGIGDLLFA